MRVQRRAADVLDGGEKASFPRQAHHRFLQLFECAHLDLAYPFAARFGAGTVGAHYRDFIAESGFTAEGLTQTSRVEGMGLDAPHPVAWFGRRQRDVHDIWHVLTGYQANEHLGEVCLVAFTFAQTRGLGWGLIAAGGALKALREARGHVYARAVWEGFQRGRRATWLPGEDYEALLAEPLMAARRRLGIADASRYHRAQALAIANNVSFGPSARATDHQR